MFSPINPTPVSHETNLWEPGRGPIVHTVSAVEAMDLFDRAVAAGLALVRNPKQSNLRVMVADKHPGEFNPTPLGDYRLFMAAGMEAGQYKSICDAAIQRIIEIAPQEGREVRTLKVNEQSPYSFIILSQTTAPPLKPGYSRPPLATLLAPAPSKVS